MNKARVKHEPYSCASMIVVNGLLSRIRLLDVVDKVF